MIITQRQHTYLPNKEMPPLMKYTFVGVVLGVVVSRCINLYQDRLCSSTTECSLECKALTEDIVSAAPAICGMIAQMTAVLKLCINEFTERHSD